MINNVNSYPFYFGRVHYDDVIMGAIASLITSLVIVYSTVYPDADQWKHQSSASLAFVRGIHRWPASNAENVSIWWRHHGLMAAGWELSTCDTEWQAEGHVLNANTTWISNYMHCAIALLGMLLLSHAVEIMVWIHHIILSGFNS